MNTMTNKDMPNKPTVRYRLKADRSMLRRLMDEAHSIIQQDWIKKYDQLISSAATEHLEFMYPVEDMTVLHKYEASRSEERIGILIYNTRTEHWDTMYLSTLTRPVLVTRNTDLSALRPQWWDSPLLGISPEYRKEMSEEEWDGAVESNKKARANQLPVELDYIFESYLDRLEAYRQDMRVTSWIDERKQTEGKYPTWGEIVEHSPVLLQLEEFKGWEKEREAKGVADV